MLKLEMWTYSASGRRVLSPKKLKLPFSLGEGGAGGPGLTFDTESKSAKKR